MKGSGHWAGQCGQDCRVHCFICYPLSRHGHWGGAEEGEGASVDRLMSQLSVETEAHGQSQLLD